MDIHSKPNGRKFYLFQKLALLNLGDYFISLLWCFCVFVSPKHNVVPRLTDLSPAYLVNITGVWVENVWLMAAILKRMTDCRKKWNEADGRMECSRVVSLASSERQNGKCVQFVYATCCLSFDNVSWHKWITVLAFCSLFASVQLFTTICCSCYSVRSQVAVDNTRTEVNTHWRIVFVSLIFYNNRRFAKSRHAWIFIKERKELKSTRA